MFLQAVVIYAAEEGRGGERVGRPSPSPPTPRQYFFLIQYHISEQGGRICAKLRDSAHALYWRQAE